MQQWFVSLCSNKTQFSLVLIEIDPQKNEIELEKNDTSLHINYTLVTGSVITIYVLTKFDGSVVGKVGAAGFQGSRREQVKGDRGSFKTRPCT